MINSMKSIPILFKAEMVKAILEGRKTQTRRVAKQFNDDITDLVCEDGGGNWIGWSGYLDHRELPDFTKKEYPNGEGYPCPYGKVGDHLWVKETFQFVTDPFSITENVMYKADGETKRLPAGTFKDGQQVYNRESKNIKWRPSLFMPRYASRITLEIVSVRCERLNEISEADAADEGLEGKWFPNIGSGTFFYKNYLTGEFGLIPSASYRTLWESINGVGSWDLNPFVWVIEFKKQLKND
jgi:hypothetical protein